MIPATTLNAPPTPTHTALVLPESSAQDTRMALEAAGVTVLGLEEGEQRVTLLVKRDDEDAALCAVHDALVPR